ncbi:unnamed protein product [Oppiella nova]|uniref:Alanyl-transfer RNA synthetases family profile domain-containing protein n=1 Tax=Oppiella nova TaxID=334625 RepID=A0A7R9M9S5_9ACAR|nr:unnamed protein product [Oppiella nova]CAG2173316.1 unnamed protein product [Oppiella nova]
MVFMCQTDSYLKQFKTNVKTCKSSELKSKGNKLNGFEVTLEDTILFPEGGGQPSDFGTIDGKQVVDVRRDGDIAVHFVVSDGPLEVGRQVDVEVDWKRRFDHMQQHSGQHLITAIAEQTFALKTTSWSLGEEISSIELDAKEVSEESVRRLESLVNEKIRESVPVSITLFDRNDERLKEVSTRLLIPEDQSGPIRVVSLEGIDRNTCCGTHVSNLSHLQSIKLLSAEKGKKNKTNLYFLSGNRVLFYLDKCYKREKALNTSLKCTSDDFMPMTEKMKKSLKISQKILNEVKQEISDTLVVLSVTDDSTDLNSSGQLALAGNQELIQQFIPNKGCTKGWKIFGKSGKFVEKSKIR